MNPYFCKTAFALSAILILGSLLFRFTIISGQNREIDRLATAYLKARTKTDPDYKLQSSIHKAQQDRNSVVSSLPAFHKFPYIVKDISDLIQKNDLTSSGLLFKPIKTARLGLWEYGSQFSVRGGYPDIKSFIAELHLLAGLNTISRLSFTKMPEIRDEVTIKDKISLDINIALYCRGD
ncbi:MAG: type 4a pilus biogenesis protein PilO [Desulfamplus sp.]|nr:type 4a pilus biogenesis protein PilO [Desulfamplus sp.]